MVLETPSARPSSPSAFEVGCGLGTPLACAAASQKRLLCRNLPVQVLTPFPAAAGSCLLERFFVACYTAGNGAQREGSLLVAAFEVKVRVCGLCALLTALESLQLAT